MAITATQAIAFSRDVVRPVCERLRALDYEIRAHLVRWNAIMDQVIPDDAQEVLEDGRTNEGVTTLTGADIHNVMEILGSIKTLMDVNGNREVIDKPCVRVLQAS